MTKVLIITGPTATGKTALGIELARQFNGEIISADSRQVYRGNDVETGKDRSFPQWGIDIVEPGANFSVSDFVSYAQKKIADITARGKLPIVVGGTGQYIKELLSPSETLHIPPNPKLRAKLGKLPVEKLQKELKKVNPRKFQAMNVSDQNNPRRLIRAVEIALVSSVKGFHPVLEGTDNLIIGLTAPKEVLLEKIIARRHDQPDLVDREFALAKKQLVYMKKYLTPVWFDITDPRLHNKIQWQVEKFIRPPATKRKNFPNI